MSGEHAYRVVVTVEDGKWLASVPELPGAHTYEPNLVALDWSVREVIALVEDLQEGAERFLHLSYSFEGNAADGDYLAAGILRERSRLYDEEETLLRQTGAAAAHLLRSTDMRLDEVARQLSDSAFHIYQCLIAYDPELARTLPVPQVPAPARPSPKRQPPRHATGAA